MKLNIILPEIDNRIGWKIYWEFPKFLRILENLHGIL